MDSVLSSNLIILSPSVDLVAGPSIFLYDYTKYFSAAFIFCILEELFSSVFYS